MSVGLNKALYLWNANNSEVTELFDLGPSQNYVSSVSWMPGGNVLAVGTSAGAVQVCSIY